MEIEAIESDRTEKAESYFRLFSKRLLFLVIIV